MVSSRYSFPRTPTAHLIAALSLAASLAVPSVTGAAPGGAAVRKGDLVAVRVDVNAPSASNAFAFSLRYPAGRFDGVSLSTNGVCDYPFSVTKPADGQASLACGIGAAGLVGKGTVATVFLRSTKDQKLDQGEFNLTKCRTFADDGRGTRVGAGCSSYSASAAVTTAQPSPLSANILPSSQAPVRLRQNCSISTGDLNCDGKTTGRDLSILLHSYGTANPQADVDQDGRVNLTDFAIAMAHYAK